MITYSEVNVKHYEDDKTATYCCGWFDESFILDIQPECEQQLEQLVCVLQKGEAISEDQTFFGKALVDMAQDAAVEQGIRHHLYDLFDVSDEISFECSINNVRLNILLKAKWTVTNWEDDGEPCGWDNEWTLEKVSIEGETEDWRMTSYVDDDCEEVEEVPECSEVNSKRRPANARPNEEVFEREAALVKEFCYGHTSISRKFFVLRFPDEAQAYGEFGYVCLTLLAQLEAEMLRYSTDDAVPSYCILKEILAVARKYVDFLSDGDFQETTRETSTDECCKMFADWINQTQAAQVA